MAKDIENKAAEPAQEPSKREKAYKVTCGTFKSRNKALQSAAAARKAGVNVSLEIEKTNYILMYAAGLSKEAAEAAKKQIEAAKVKAEICEQ